MNKKLLLSEYNIHAIVIYFSDYITILRFLVSP